MSTLRRGLLLAALAACSTRAPGAGLIGTPAGLATGPPEADPVRRGRPMQFPRDHGAHLGSRIEWWYATGWLQAQGLPQRLGFQVTFFRSATGLATDLPGRLAPRHLLFAHAALSDPARGRHRHADRIARWSGQPLPELRARAATQDADIVLAGWSFLRRDAAGGSLYETRVQSGDFGLQLALQTTQPVLLQGDAGFSRKGPQEQQASHYVTEPQLQARGEVQLDGQRLPVQGRAWFDHEWSDELLHPQAVGWDWIGMNLDDGRALTAFQLRRADGSTLWAGGSLRGPGETTARSFAPDELRMVPGRRWRSPGSNAEYPVQWTVHTPAGRFDVISLMDAQELDGRGSTGTVYWEGLSELRDAQQRVVGHGYLEMTGYAGQLRL
ncbi:MAG: carotenoid 1,2-hydratase [Rubrivivax sp.]|nr:carotenoid 1,2-hydratase [Rubrivivax sp.]